MYGSFCSTEFEACSENLFLTKHFQQLFFPNRVLGCVWECFFFLCFWMLFKGVFSLKKHWIDDFLSIFWWFWCVDVKNRKRIWKKIHFNIFSSEKLFWKPPFTTISNTDTLPPELYSFSMNFRTLILYLCKYEPQRMCHAIWTWHLELGLCSMNLKSFRA